MCRFISVDFFQTLKHRAWECARVFRVSVLSTFRNRICAPTDYMILDSIKYHPGMGGFPDRELTDFQTQAALGSPVLRITVPQKCDHRFSQFVKCQNSIGNTKCYVSWFSSLRTLIRTRRFDVTASLDLEVTGCVKGAKGAFKCPLWHARVCLRRALVFMMQCFVFVHNSK